MVVGIPLAPMAHNLGPAPTGPPPPPPPAVHAVAIPAQDELLRILSTGDAHTGLVSIMSDIYTQMNLLSSSIGVALHNHMSTNNINHDSLEGFVHANSVHIDENRQSIAGVWDVYLSWNIVFPHLYRLHLPLRYLQPSPCRWIPVAKRWESWALRQSIVSGLTTFHALFRIRILWLTIF